MRLVEGTAYGGRMTPAEAFARAEAMLAELKAARILSGRDGVVVAQRAGLERCLVLKSEAGISQPRLTTLIRWADVLGYDLRLVKKAP